MFPDECLDFGLELEDEFIKIVPSSFGRFICHHQGLFVCIKSFFFLFKNIFSFFITLQNDIIFFLIIFFFRRYRCVLNSLDVIGISGLPNFVFK